jgi:hypothetical protein
VKFTWKGRWKNGEIILEAETIEEISSVIEKLYASSALSQPDETSNRVFPLIPAGLGCSDAILTVLGSECGIQQRSMAEIRKVLEANALFFSKGTLSGTLNFLAKKRKISRGKSAGTWVYNIEPNVPGK